MVTQVLCLVGVEVSDFTIDVRDEGSIMQFLALLVCQEIYCEPAELVGFRFCVQPSIVA